jgi:DNA gyrase subunit A
METAGLVRQRNINEEMREAYLDYAMSVIVSRALPDARDGLKPVHRRILYAMHTMGSGPAAPYRKSARIVGEVLGKYHPHGDVAVYDAMVRMAQDFSMRYELVDGQGNFGSIDGDSAAAMRYTEARIAALGDRLLEDIERNTVDFADNFDGSLREPIVLPSSIPNLLVNGSSGIAVGMSTSIPPHNLGEVCDALIYMLDSWDNLEDITVSDLMRFIEGPDFPTGGLIYARESDDGDNRLLNAYATGRGKVVVRAKVHLEALDRGRSRIIVSEIPFQINKTSLIERIATLVQSGRIEGIIDLRDESDRQGLRIVIEVSRTADAAEVLADLFKYTPLQSTFSIIILALVNDEPRMLTLKQALRIYIEHRLEVVRRRSEYELEKAEHRAHILEGLLTALDDIDKAIAIIRRSRTPETARNNLIREFKLTEIQAQAILDMRLRRLAAMERKALEEEYDTLVKLIEDLNALLQSPKLMRLEIKRELNELRKNYVDPRRTVIVDAVPGNVTAGDLLVPQDDTFVTLTQGGLLSRTYEDELPKIPRRKGADKPRFICHSTTADVLYLFTTDGMAASIPVSQLPQAREPQEGQNFSTIAPLDDREIAAILSIPPSLEEGYLFFYSQQGEVKRLRLEDLPGIRADAFHVFDVEEGDRLLRVDVVFEDEEVMLVTHDAQAVRFSVENVRPTGLSAGGMRGVKFKDDSDYVVGAGVVRDEDMRLLVMTDDGRGKRSPLEEYPTQGRGVGGVRTLKQAKGLDNLIQSAALVDLNLPVLVISDKGQVLPLNLNKVPETKRDYKADFFDFVLDMGDSLSSLLLVEPKISNRYPVGQDEEEEILEGETVTETK